MIAPARCLALSGLVVAAFVAPPASAAAEPPAGRPCGFETVRWDPVLGEGLWTGSMYGGPLVAAGSALSLTCTVQVNGVTAASATAGPTAHAVLLVPTPLSYVASDVDAVTMCSVATVDAATWRWDGTAWTANPDTPCPRAETTDPQTWCMTDLVDCLVDFVNGDPFGLDPVFCAFLVNAAPGFPGVVDIRPEGDVYLLGDPFWDCPPYTEWSTA